MLLVGGSEFSLVGRPVVGRNLQKIEATVVEKTPAADKIVQKFKPRKNYDVKWSEFDLLFGDDVKQLVLYMFCKV